MCTKILILILVQINFFLVVLGDPIVQLPNGTIVGREAITLANKHYYAFEGIPYAEPPVGAFRFMAPQTHQHWDDTLDTTSYTRTCFQGSFDTLDETEDCLHLNIYTPLLPEDDSTTLLPVMFLLNGEGFTDGNLQRYQPELFIDNDVILVTVNYRLGIYGFLSTHDEVIPGNAGLKDQQLALKWTHENIHLFGGNENQTTIFGQGSGAASVTYQLLTFNTSGLIQGAILQSGTLLGPWAFQRNPRQVAFETAGQIRPDVGSSNDSQVLLKLMQAMNPRDLDILASMYVKSRGLDNSEYFQGFSYAPIIESKSREAFFTKKMYGLVNAGNLVPVPTLMGITSEEALTLFPDAARLKGLMQTLDENLDYLVPYDMQISDVTNRTKMGNSIKSLYTGNQSLADNLGNAIKYCSDNIITRSVIKYAELYSKVENVYFYQFSYKGAMGSSNVHYDGAERVGHGEDLSYLFCSNCVDSMFPASDRSTRQRLIKMWTDFAKYQNPTPQPSSLLQNVTFPTVNTEDGNFYYLDIGENLEVKNHPKEGTYEGWNDLYNSLDFSDFDTY